jgi:protein phosphatase
MFQDYEYLSADEIRYSLSGDTTRMELNPDVYAELFRRASIKLKLGERVVIDAPNLKRDDRIAAAQVGQSFGVPVFYLVFDEPLQDKLTNSLLDPDLVHRQHENFQKSERDVLRGDSVAEVIDLRQTEFNAIQKPHNEDDLISYIQRLGGFRGVTVIGDVHGTLESMKTAVNWARARRHFIVLLGDVLDYGPKPLECVDIAYDVIMRGEGTLILGNHERKIERYLYQKAQGQVRVRISDGNKVTIDALKNASKEYREQWIKRFRALCAQGRNHWVGGTFLFTHGAASPEMFQIRGRRLPYRSDFEMLAYFGEIDGEDPKRTDGYPNRVYNWVDRIPEGHTVIVGHDIRDTYQPLTVKGELGGTAIFLDTGSGKGGTLSTADLKIQDGDFKVTNFNKH